MAICILQHDLPWHLDGAEEGWVLFLSEPLIQCDLEHVLHHLSHCWSQHSDQRNQTSAHQMEQKMPSIKRIHCTNTRLCLICLWAQNSGQCLQVFPLSIPSHWHPHLSLWRWFLGCTRQCLLQAAEMILCVSWEGSVCHWPYPEALCSPLLQTVSPWPGLSSLCVCVRLHARRLCLSWGLKNTAIKPAINNSTRQGVKLTDGIWVITSASWWHDLGGRLLNL